MITGASSNPRSKFSLASIYPAMEHMGLDSIERNMMKTMLVSACLLGVSCRWHAKKIAPSKAVERFLENHPGVKVIPICPEELGGLPTPRPPVKTVRGRVFETVPDKELRASVTGKDVIITLCGLYNNEEVLNAALEFAGPGVASLSMDARM